VGADGALVGQFDVAEAEVVGLFEDEGLHRSSLPR
jgi:hypothetical protein